MIDYNKKFKDLNNKITGIIEENKNDNKIVNRYISKLEMIEKKFIGKFCYFDKSFIKLKEHFTKLSNQYQENLKKEMNNNIYENKINDLNNKIEFDLKMKKDENINYINSIFENLEKSILKIKDKDIKEKNIIKKDSDEFKEESEMKIKIYNECIEKEKEETNKFNDEFKNSIKSVFNEINQQLKEEETHLDTNNENQNIKIKEIEEQINESIENQIKLNEERDKKMLLIINEACTQFKDE